MQQDYFMLSKSDTSSDEGSPTYEDLNVQSYLLGGIKISKHQFQHSMNENVNQTLPTLPLEKKKKSIKKSPAATSDKKKRKVRYSNKISTLSENNSSNEEQEEQNQLCTYLNKQMNRLNSNSTSGIWSDESQEMKEKMFQVSLLSYQVRSNYKFYMSSSKVISMDWFTKDPYHVFDMELYSDFNPVEQIIYHKKEGVFELGQTLEQYPPDNLEYIVRCLDSTSSQNAHILAELLREVLKRSQYKNRMIQAGNINTEYNISELKRRALEVIEQQDPQKIFSYNIFAQDPDFTIKKLSQGYSEGFLKMMGASKTTFSSFVMKHKGFEAFSGKSRLNTIVMVLCKELGLNPNFHFDETAEVKTFDDYILSLTPIMKFYPLNENNSSFIVISHFDVDVDQLLRLENIRKREQLPHFQQDFRYQCQVQNFVEKFYPNKDFQVNVDN